MKVTLLSYSDVTPPNLYSYRKAAEVRGIELEEVEPHRLSCHVTGTDRQTLLDGAPYNPEVVVHRTVAPMYSVVRPALHLLSDAGIAVLNHPDASWTARDKLLTAIALSKASVPCVATLGIYPGKGARFDRRFDARIAKPALGVRGNDVVLLPSADSLQDFLLAQNWPGPQGHYVAQPLVGTPGTDYRSYVVDGRCLGVMERRSPTGDFRANLAQGATARAVDRPDIAQLALEAVAALGLDHAGVDVLEGSEGLMVLEVDAWAGFAGLERACNADAAGAVLDLALIRSS